MLPEDAAARAMAAAAQRLQRLRAAQAAPKPAAIDLPVAAVAEVVIVAPVQPVVQPEAPVAEAVVTPAAEIVEAEVVQDERVAEVAEVVEIEAPAPDAAPVIEAAPFEETVAEDAQDDDALLSRLGAATETVEAEVEAVEPVAETAADDDMLNALRVTLAAEEPMAEAVAPDAAPAVAFPEEGYDAEELPEDAAETLSHLPEEAADFDDLPEAVTEEAEAIAVPAEVAPQTHRSDEVAGESVTDAPVLEMAPAAEEPVAEEPVVQTPVIQAEPVEVTAPMVADKIQRARARVIKIRRLDTALRGEDTLAPAVETVSLDQPRPAAPQPETPKAETARTELARTEPTRLPQAETDEASMDRLMEKANSELEEPQTKRRRSAIAHLKAAVLATVAERRANLRGLRPEDSQREDPYRKDLDQAMRPAAEKPAPLVLMPTARIDRRVEAAPVSTAPNLAPAIHPVRPRRVSAAAASLAERPAYTPPAFSPEEDELAALEVSNVFEENPNQSFEEFAERIGASSLQDMIEAAGAYLTLVKGHGAFTRPELFQQLASVGAETSREDGLRGFGRLLREGRLTKTQAGLYALTETSPMLAHAKRHAG